MSSQPSLWDDDSLSLARQRLEEALDEGTTCPCCGQHAQRYKWSLYSTACLLLIRFWVAGDTTDYVESKRVKGNTQGSASHLALWDLVEHEKERRPDGGKSGWWRVTTRGERFIKGWPIPKHAWVYNGTVQRYEGPQVTISDRLGYRFDWREHMRGDS